VLVIDCNYAVVKLVIFYLEMVFRSVIFTLLISDYQFFTPPLKRKADGVCESHVLPFAGMYFFFLDVVYPLPLFSCF
jgi:hypothetical protein